MVQEQDRRTKAQKEAAAIMRVTRATVQNLQALADKRLSQAQEALKALQTTGREALSHKAQDQLLEKKKKALQDGKPRISKNLQALERIKELLALTPRPSISTIAKEIGYPRGTVAGYVKQMTGPGEP